MNWSVKGMRWGIVLIVALVFGRLLGAEFVIWDDTQTVSRNEDLNPPTVPKVMSYWGRAGRDSPMAIYIPLTYTVWGGVAGLSYLETPDELGIHLNPLVFHAVNVGLHIGGAVIVFELLRRMVREDRAAFLGAILWGIHPVMVEAVGWVSGLKDVLSGVLMLGGMWLYLRFVETSNGMTIIESHQAIPNAKRAREEIEYSTTLENRRSPMAFYLGAVGLFVLACLSKPSAMVFPALCAVMDRVIVGRGWKEIAKWCGPMLVISLATAIVAKWSQPILHVPVPPLWQRPAVVGDTIVFYLRQLVAPIWMGIDYGRLPVEIAKRPMSWVMLGGVIVLAGVIWTFRKRAPLTALGSLIAIISISPVLGLVPFQMQRFSTPADHYLYVAMLGVALAVAELLSRLKNDRVVWFASAILLLLGIRSIVQAGTWEDSHALYSNALRVNPNSFAAMEGLGVDAKQRGRREEAEQWFKKAVELNQVTPGTYTLLATLSVELGKISEAARYLESSIAMVEAAPPQLKSKWRSLDAYRTLAFLQFRLGRLQEARAAMSIVFQEVPGDPEMTQLKQIIDMQSTTQPAREK